MPIEQPLAYESPEQLQVRLEALEPEEPTTKNYWDSFSPIALTGTRPDLQQTDDDLVGDGIDVDDPFVKQLLRTMTPDEQLEFINSNNILHGLKKLRRREVRNEALEAISHDPFMTQLVRGLPPAILGSPTTLIGGGPVFNVLKVGKSINALTNITRAGIASGAIAGTVGALDEGLFMMQGTEGYPMSAMAYGAAFGFGVGSLGQWFAGRGAQGAARAFSEESDTWTRDWEQHPEVAIDYDPVTSAPLMSFQAKGVEDIAQQPKLWIDRIPWLGKALDSDVVRVYTGGSAVARKEMSKLVAPINSVYDSRGNLVAVSRTGDDFRVQRKSVYTKREQDIGTAFGEAKKAGYKGNLTQFRKEASDLYYKTMNDRELAKAEYIREKVHQFDNEYGDPIARFMEEDFKRTVPDEDAQATFLERQADIEEGRVSPPKKPLTGDEDVLEVAAKAEAERMKKRNEVKKKAAEEFEADPVNKPKFETTNPGLAKAAEATHAAYVDHLKMNQKLKMKGMEGISENEIYAPRLIDWEKFQLNTQFLDKFKRDLFRALKNHPANDDLTDEFLNGLVEHYVKAMQETKFKQNFAHSSYISPEVIGTGFQDLPGAARMLDRKFNYDSSMLTEYFITDADELFNRYHYQMAGRQALKYATGLDKASEISDYMKQIGEEMLATEGRIDEEAITSLKNTLLDLSGQLRLNSLSNEPLWRATRAMQAYNSARFGWGFGANQLIEAVTAAFQGGISNVFNGRLGTSIKQSAKMLYTNTKTSDQFGEFLVGSGLMEDVLHNSRINAYADMQMGFSPRGAELMFGKLADKTFKYNGMRYLKGVMEDMSGSAAITEMKRIGREISAGKNLSDIDLKRLKRMGFEDIQQFHKVYNELEAYVDFAQGRFELDKFSPDVLEQLQLATTRTINGIVVQGDSLHLPAWFKTPSIFKTTMFQFLRFPMIAHNVLLRRGLGEEQARFFAGIISATVVGMSLKYLREQATIALGIKEPYEAEYNYFDEYKQEEAIKKGLMYAINYVGPLGMLSTIGTGGARGMGIELPGDKFRIKSQVGEIFLGPTGSAMQDVLDLMYNATSDQYSSRKALQKAQSLLVPNVPIAQEALKEIIKHGI